MNKIMLGNHLRELRRKFALTQKQVADALHIDRSTYSYYELGKTWPDPPTLVFLAQLFGIGMLELLSPEQNTTASFLYDSEQSDLKRSRKRNRSSMLTNTSKIYDLPDDEQQLILYYRIMTAEQKESLLNDAEQYSAETMEKTKDSDES